MSTKESPQKKEWYGKYEEPADEDLVYADVNSNIAYITYRHEYVKVRRMEDFTIGEEGWITSDTWSLTDEMR